MCVCVCVSAQQRVFWDSFFFPLPSFLHYTPPPSFFLILTRGYYRHLSPSRNRRSGGNMHLGGPDFISTSLEQAQSGGSGSGSSSGSSSGSNSSSGSAAASSSASAAATRTTPTSSRGETAGEGSRSTFSVQSDGSTSRQTFQTLDHVMRAPSSLLPEVVVLDSMPEGLDRKEVLDPKEDLWLSTADG